MTAPLGGGGGGAWEGGFREGQGGGGGGLLPGGGGGLQEGWLGEGSKWGNLGVTCPLALVHHRLPLPPLALPLTIPSL